MRNEDPPDDGFAGFEIYDQILARVTRFGEPKASDDRDPLRTGCEHPHREGLNPYVLGAIGSSDSHNATSENEEATYHGKLPMMEGSAGLRLGVSTLSFLPKLPSIWGAAGLAAVWAEENSCASILAATKRRETFATSGPRISIRLSRSSLKRATSPTTPESAAERISNMYDIASARVGLATKGLDVELHD